MQRPYIDRAIHAQLERLTAVLRDVERSGGQDRWSHLHSHGHAFATVRSAIRQGLLRGAHYRYEITPAGKKYLTDLEVARMMELP